MIVDNKISNLKRYQNLHEPNGKLVHENESNDIFWGRHSTQAILESDRPIHRIWCTSELRSSPKYFQLLKDSKSSGVLGEEVSWSRLGQLTNGAVHQGIVIQIAAADTLDLPWLMEGC